MISAVVGIIMSIIIVYMLLLLTTLILLLCFIIADEAMNGRLSRKWEQRLDSLFEDN